MGTKHDVFKSVKVTLKKGVFELKETYKHAYEWLESKNYTVTEKKYSEKITESGRELEIEWEADRDIDEYSKYWLKIKWKLQGVVDVEVQQEGAKVKMQQGEITMEVTAQIETDYDDKWEATPMMRFMRRFYEHYLYKETFRAQKDRLWDEGWEFVNETKAYLHLYQYM